MAYVCAKCGNSVQSVVGINASVARTESCPSCQSDLHCCIQCVHYNTNAYNGCQESQAERVVDKERSNFCDYFAISEHTTRKAGMDMKSKAMSDLDALFKK